MVQGCGLFDVEVLEILAVAQKELVAPLAAEDDFVPLFCDCFEQQVERHGGGVVERFVEGVEDPFRRLHKIVLRDLDGDVFQPQRIGGRFGVVAFVVIAVLVVTQGKGGQFHAAALYHGGQQGAVDAPGEQGSHRHVGIEAQRERPLQLRFDFAEGFGFVGVNAGGGIQQVVITLCLYFVIAVEKKLPGRELVDAFEESVRRRGGQEAQIAHQRLVVETLFGKERNDSLDLRSKHEPFAVKVVKERFFPEAVAEEVEGIAVEQGDGEHADETVDERDAPLFIGGDQDFGVAFGLEVEIKLFLQGPEVVDFAVEAEQNFAASHRLVGALVEIHDAQAVVGEEQPFTFDDAAVVGAAVGHGLEGGAGGGRVVVAEDSEDGAHLVALRAVTGEA